MSRLRENSQPAAGDRLRTFLKDHDGAVAVIFAFATLPMVLLIGGAVDYSRAIGARSNLQQALDAGVLAAAVKGGNPDSGQLARYLNSNMSPGGAATNVTLTRSVATGGAVTFVGDADFSVATNFLKMAGLGAIKLHSHSEATLPAQIVTATFKPTSAQGAYSKDIFIWTKNAAGTVVSRQTVLTYRYNSSNGSKVTTPAIGSWSLTFTVPLYSTFGVGMVVYQDWQKYSGALVNPVELWSDAANASTFMRQSGLCTDAAGATYNWEDGGDGNFVDFVYTMKCATGVAAKTVARLSK